MKVAEEINHEELTQEKQDELFYTMLNGKTITEEIETTRGKFTIKFPKQKDILLIDRRVAIMRNGIPAESFDASANFNLQKIAFLDVVVESGEKWFDNIKSKNRNFSWGDMPDINFVDEVYYKAWSFRDKVQMQFGRNDEKTDNGISDGESVSENVDDGLFSGVAATVK